MKGVIFNLLEDAVTQAHGVCAWSAMVDSSGVAGAYTSLGSYPDSEILALVDTAAVSLQSNRAALLRWFGSAAIPGLHAKYAEFFDPHPDTRSFLLSVNDIIHPEVRKLYSGAACPNFLFDEDEAGHLLVGYNSPRQMCQLAHGFIEGASAHYGEHVAIDHLACMDAGDLSCLMRVDWPAGAVH